MDMDVDTCSEQESTDEINGNQNIDADGNFTCIGANALQKHSQPNRSIPSISEIIIISDSDSDSYDNNQPETKSNSNTASRCSMETISQQQPDVVDNSKPETSKHINRQMKGGQVHPHRSEQGTSQNMREQINEDTSPISIRRSSRRAKNTTFYSAPMECDSDKPSTSYQPFSNFAKTATKPFFTLDPSRIPKNNDITVFYSNFLYKSLCFLCGVSDKHLAKHYAQKHPDTEVFIARVSPTMASKLRKQQCPFIEIDGNIHGWCYFCEEPKVLTKENWMKHLLAHTGEQRFLCSSCATSMPRNIKHGKCSKEAIQDIFKAESGDLTGYICNTCNYLQIQENQLVKHLQEHDTFDANDNEIFSRVVLVKNYTTS